MPRVFIAIPHTGFIVAPLAEVLLAWGRSWKEKLKVYMASPIPAPVDVARNVCVREFLNTDATHLFFLDADVAPPHNALEVLLSHNREIVSALVFTSLPDENGQVWPVPCAFRMHDGKLRPYFGRGLVEVDAIGMGCVLIRRNVFETLEPPWFCLRYDRSRTTLSLGEDLDFCEKARAHGFRIFVDYNLVCDHFARANLGAWAGALARGGYDVILNPPRS